MPSFKKNRSTLNITEKGEKIIEQAEDIQSSSISRKPIKEITIPFTQEMSNLLEEIFNHFEGDISRRKLCARYLLRSLKDESRKLKLV